ncbi:Retrotransposable element Tf2 protein type 1-like protein [Dinothrombium tinctorium]|uniref:RNA-directed DNA polymerase n=1 Tax=Dinothrombium tinctorium TaxID=1965070 RepID=A0A443Q8S9_9ACAR|nr:Retrotransposable element Tf2 protein type 1-like protein [Dinothrombium tinctorium]
MVRHNKINKAYVPQTLRPKLLNKFHEDHGHPGKRKTIKLISNHYWWPDIIKDIKKHVESCKNCQLVKTRHTPRYGQYIKPDHDLQPNDLWGIDTIVMGPAANKTRHKYIQVIVDHFSRYVWAFPTAVNSSAAIVTILNGLIKSGTKPKRILTDCHKNFSSSTLNQFLRKYNIRHSYSTPYHPQTNGIVEKVNGTIITKLRASLLDHPKRKWSTLLTDAIKAYNNTPHDITGFSPRFLHFGQEEIPSFASPNDIETARQIARQRTKEHQNRRKEVHDTKHNLSPFQVGDKVVREIPANHPTSNKLSPKFTGPFLIVKQLADVTYDIAENLSGDTKRAHASQLRKFVARQQTQQSGEDEATPQAPSIN